MAGVYTFLPLGYRVLDKNRKYILITCLLYAISYTVLSTGHFAQYLVKGNDLEAMKKRK